LGGSFPSLRKNLGGAGMFSMRGSTDLSCDIINGMVAALDFGSIVIGIGTSDFAIFEAHQTKPRRKDSDLANLSF
jgi:hypothetical protein